MNPKNPQSLADEIAALNAGGAKQYHEHLPPDDNGLTLADLLDTDEALEEFAPTPDTIDATLEGSLPAEQQEKPAKKQKKQDKSDKDDSDKSDDSGDSETDSDQSEGKSDEKSEEEKQKEQEQKQKEEQLWVQFALARSRCGHPSEAVASYADYMLKEYNDRFNQ